MGCGGSREFQPPPMVVRPNGVGVVGPVLGAGKGINDPQNKRNFNSDNLDGDNPNNISNNNNNNSNTDGMERKLLGKEKYIKEYGALLMSDKPKGGSELGILFIFCEPGTGNLIISYREHINGNVFVRRYTDEELVQAKDSSNIKFPFAPFFKSIATAMLKSKAVVTPINPNKKEVSFSITNKKEPNVEYTFVSEISLVYHGRPLNNPNPNMKVAPNTVMNLAPMNNTNWLQLYQYIVMPMIYYIQHQRREEYAKILSNPGPSAGGNAQGNTNDNIADINGVTSKYLLLEKLECDIQVHTANLNKFKDTIDRLLPFIRPLREESAVSSQIAMNIGREVRDLELNIRIIKEKPLQKHPIDHLYEEGGAQYFQHTPWAQAHQPHPEIPEEALTYCIRAAFPLNQHPAAANNPNYFAASATNKKNNEQTSSTLHGSATNPPSNLSATSNLSGANNKLPSETNVAANIGNSNALSGGGGMGLKLENIHLILERPDVKKIIEQRGAHEMVHEAFDIFKGIDRWDFDTIQLEIITNGNALFYTTYLLLYKLNLVKHFEIDDKTLQNFLIAVQASYHPNPYHNAMHGADVTQINYYIMMIGGLAEKCKLSKEEILAGLLAGAVHDFDHPGLNNNFHTRTNAYLSTLYNDRSILENHHVACTFELLRQPKYNILASMNAAQKQLIRETILEMVLATDMGNHAKIFKSFQVRMSESTDWHTKKEDLRLALSMSIKMADISNCARPNHIYAEWAKNISREFYLQGDAERKLKLSISPFMDRTKEKEEFPKGQLSFMMYIVMPMCEAISDLLPSLRFIIDLCNENKEYWRRKENEKT